MRLGEGLLLDALKRSLDISASLGVHALDVYAIDSEAAGFYLKYDFTSPIDDSLHLYLPVATIERLFG